MVQEDTPALSKPEQGTASASEFRYILRYLIDPSFESEARIADLLQICREGRIEEVMLLIAAEELHPGHINDEELKTYLDMAVKLKAALDAEGIALSLNPWTTLGQVPRGRRLREGQHFRLMVGETGQTNNLVACPLCTEWQQYLARTFAHMAEVLQPVAIWIEDDWRLHNHGPELGWGGCFCEEHLKRFSEKVGQPVTREQLIETILQPGKPHPWRALWLEIGRDSVLEPMRVIRKAIQTASPGTRIALMSSRPDIHSIEGRDWPALQEAIGREPTFLLRPHMEPYTEERALRTTASVARHTIACLEGPIGIYPELENSPRCGIYSKSQRHTIWQMLEAACFGSPGITINHYDNMGNGSALDPDFAAALAKPKAILGAIAALGIDDRKAEGLQILFSPRIASHVELPPPPAGTVRGKVDGAALSLQMQQNPSGGGSDGFAGSLQSLVHPSVVWAETCSILGIAHRLTPSPDPNAAPILVSGQTLRALSEDQIQHLLSGVLVLDAKSLEVLFQRGFGQDVGITGLQWRKQTESVYSYESIREDDPTVYGVTNPRLCAQRCAAALLQPTFSSDAPVKVLSDIRTPDHHILWPATWQCPTPQGGLVVATTYPIESGSQFFMAYFNTFRRQFWQNVLLDLNRGGKLLMGPDGTRVYRHSVQDGSFIAVLNPTLDTRKGYTLRAEPNAFAGGSWQYLDDNGHWQPFTPTHLRPGEWAFDFVIPHLEGSFLLHRK